MIDSSSEAEPEELASAVAERNRKLDTESKRRRRKCEKLIDAAEQALGRQESLSSEAAMDPGAAMEALHQFCQASQANRDTFRRKYAFKRRAKTKGRGYYFKLHKVLTSLSARFNSTLERVGVKACKPHTQTHTSTHNHSHKHTHNHTLSHKHSLTHTQARSLCFLPFTHFHNPLNSSVQ